MPITPPVPGQEVSTSLWGVPITNEVNQLRTDLTATTGVANGKVAKAGDTMTGDLTVAKASPGLYLNATGANDSGFLQFKDGGITRWNVFRDGASGDFYISRQDAAGVTVDYPIRVAAADGKVHVPTPTAAGHAARKDYVDTQDTLRVAKAGDTMTGDLVIAKATPMIVLDATGASDLAILYIKDNGLIRWALYRDNGNGDLIFRRYDATGTGLDDPIRVSAVDGRVTLFAAPTSTGHATRKDYVDTADGLRVLKAGDTMTGDLTVAKAGARAVVQATSGSPAIDIRRDAEPVDSRIWRLSTGAGGALYVQAFNDAYTVATNAMSFGRTGATGTTVSFASSTSVAVPPITGANQAAQVTAYDANTGRLAIGGVEMGNTGWRILVQWDIPGNYTYSALGTLTAPFIPQVNSGGGHIMVRRVGMEIQYRVTGVTLNAAILADTAITMFSPTPAFDLTMRSVGGMPMATRFSTAMLNTSGSLIHFRPIDAMASNELVVSSDGATAVGAANAGWPTVLPGIAFTPPFTG